MRNAFLVFFASMFIFCGASYGLEKVDSAGWANDSCFGYLYAHTELRIRVNNLKKSKSQCGPQCLKMLKVDEANLSVLDTWKSKLIIHLGADADTFGSGGELSYDMYMAVQNQTASEMRGQAWQERLAKHEKGVNHCWKKVIIPTIKKIR